MYFQQHLSLNSDGNKARKLILFFPIIGKPNYPVLGLQCARQTQVQEITILIVIGLPLFVV
jgi:hypothetical protein